jgi:hypothetical protein
MTCRVSWYACIINDYVIIPIKKFLKLCVYDMIKVNNILIYVDTNY